MATKHKTNAPKRPLSGYFRFKRYLMENDETIKTMSGVTSQSTYTAELWKKLTDEEKMPYNDAARKDFETYKIKNAEYKETDEYKKEQAEKKSGKVGKKKSVKRGASAYNMFVKDEMEKAKANNESLGSELQKAMSDKWKNITPEEKSKYEKMAKVLNESKGRKKEQTSSSD